MIKREERDNPASCWNKAHDDEIVFVLLGRDLAAPVAIMAWIGERLRLGMNVLSDEKITNASKCVDEMFEDLV